MAYEVHVISEDVAHIWIKGDPDEFEMDKDNLKDSIPHKDRKFDWDEKYWVVKNPEKYIEYIPELRIAWEDFIHQLRMFE